MRKLIPILAILTSLQMGIGQQEDTRGFITEFGEFSPKDSKWRVRISPQNGALEIYCKTPSGSTGALPANWRAQSGWFVFIEKEQNVWAYDGRSSLLVVETQTNGLLHAVSSKQYPHPAPEQLRRRFDVALQSSLFRHDLIGNPAPALDETQWFNSTNALSLSGLRGKVVLLDFWGQWCPPCVEKLPHSELLHIKFKDRGLVVIGVHSYDQTDKLETFLRNKKITFPIVVDTGQTAERYSITGWPTYFLVDKSGKIVWGFSNIPPDESQIETLLK